MLKIVDKRKKKEKFVDYADLEDLDCFLYYGELYIRLNDAKINNQRAYSLEDGDYRNDMCGERVKPVKVELRIIGE